MNCDLEHLIQTQHEQQRKALQLRRGHFMDVLEAMLSQHSNWEYLRKKALGFLGKNGLEGDLDRIMDETISRISEAEVES